ncbi:MAG: DUF563 domain-containing protein [Leptolyngbya sp. BL-A-14]
MVSLARKVKNRLFGSQALEPPKKWMPSKTYAEQFNATWHQVYKSTDIHQKAPIYYGSPSQKYQVAFESQLCRAYPELGVLELKQGHLVGSDGWIISQEGYLLPEHSWHGLDVDKITIARNWAKTKHSNLVYLSLASTWSHTNYGHFLLDALPRLHLFQEAGFSLKDVDKIYCPLPKSSGSRKLLEKLGVPVEKCILSAFSNYEGIQANVLIAPSFPGLKRNYPEWVANFLRTLVNQPLPSQNRRLYITRGTGSRKPINENELIDVLSKYSFEIYDPSQQTDSQNNFAEAAVIVGAHGAGLSDLVFCQPGTKVLELIPSDHVFTYYFSISEAAKLQYGCLICPSLEERSPSSFGPSPFDFHVNLQEFEAALDAMLTNS